MSKAKDMKKLNKRYAIYQYVYGWFVPYSSKHYRRRLRGL